MENSDTQNPSAGGNKSTGALLYILGALFVLTGIGILAIKGLHSPLLAAVAAAGGEAPATFWSDKLHWLGLESAILGLLAGIIGMLISRGRFQLETLRKKEHLLPGIAAVLLLVLWLPVVLFAHSAAINGETYWWLGDDAMISMRYAHNLAQGEGLVWNPGERIEGYSNFLWTVYMGFVHLLPIPLSKTSLIVLLTNLALSIATLFVIARLIRILGGDYLVTACVLAGLILSQNLMFWTTAGFEMTLLTFLFIWSLYRIIREAELGQPQWSTFLIIGLISLVRADSVILAGLCLALAFLLHPNKLKMISYTGLALLLPLAHLSFRIGYYGELLPNTAHLKALNWDGKYIAGITYVFSFIKTYAPLILLAVAGGILNKNRVPRALLGMVLLYLVYVASIGGDVFPHYRFLIPVIPLLMVLAFRGMQRLWQNANLRWVGSLLSLAMIPLILPGYAASLYPRPADMGNVKIGLLLRENTPEGARIADFWAGSVFYFSDRYAIDLLGKSDKYIAHQAKASNGMLPGHNKFDFDYSLGTCKPDFVISNFRLPVSEETLRQQATGSYAFTGQLYFNKFFQKHYLANPVTDRTWRTIFAYEASPHKSSTNKWAVGPYE